MTVSRTEDARELIRFLVTNVGHPIVLDRDDCALLADRVERALTLEKMLVARADAAPRCEPDPLARRAVSELAASMSGRY
jgi:hypothetical protein